MKKKVLLILLVVVVLISVVVIFIFNDRKVQPFVYKDLVILESPLPEAQISSPLLIKGKARGQWFFDFEKRQSFRFARTRRRAGNYSVV